MSLIWSFRLNQVEYWGISLMFSLLSDRSYWLLEIQYCLDMKIIRH